MSSILGGGDQENSNKKMCPLSRQVLPAESVIWYGDDRGVMGSGWRIEPLRVMSTGQRGVLGLCVSWVLRGVLSLCASSKRSLLVKQNFTHGCKLALELERVALRVRKAVWCQLS
jgi:hypothetical protein